MKIIIDPSLIWFNEQPEISEKFRYLYSVVNFIDKYLDAKILYSEETLQLLQKLNKDPFSEYRETRQQKRDIISMIWKHLDDVTIELDDNKFTLKNMKLSSSDKGNELFSKKNELCNSK